MVGIDLHPRLLWSIYCLDSGINQTPMRWQGGDRFSVLLMLSILTSLIIVGVFLKASLLLKGMRL